MKYLFVILSFLAFTNGFGQNMLDRSLKHYQNGEFNEARILIDSALTSELYAAENITWYLKGFIYKDLYKNSIENTEKENFRSESIVAFNTLLNMDSTEQYEQEARQNIKFLATTYFNEAIAIIDQQLFQLAKAYYTKFEETLALVNDGSISLAESKSRFYLTLGSAYVQLNAKDSIKDHNTDAVNAFEEVLAIDSTNKEANYNIGVIYYNSAVSNILDLDYDDADILAFGKFEDRTIGLFKKSLPYMKRAYQAASEDENILEGLAGIHFGLREFEISNKYKEELLALKEKK
ncbi:hypothetical protein FNH22_22990 [Fulvivirga sp. M361]|uniref:hypothetical protein n=1 Tax=Fulvivirga sp. M361 TaxID=2594266 RepID=UPI001179E22F|nr:hypothetical protein [Fulvivirga sp. M361]TRX52042.1 hypothetical protein FNH22_22990 [Fulvivirga sp. M361]